MASSYTDLLRLEKQADGENDSTWGQKNNTVFEMIEDAIAGRATVTHDDTASYTLTTENSATDEARNMILNIGGALTANRNAVVPTSAKLYFAKNATTGGFSVVVKTTAGTGITIPNGKTTAVFCDGTNVVAAIDWLPSLTIGTALTPDANDGAALGSATVSWSDLFLASGGVLNFANGNAVVTHSSGILTVSTGDLRVTTAGTNAASAATVGGTQTLTGKTINLTSNTLVATSAQLAAAVTDETGSGALVFATSPTMVTPVLGVATATSLNGLTITTSTGTLTIANGVTVTGPASSATVAALNLEDQALTGGVVVTSKGLGTVSSGTVTPDPGDRPMQHYTNGGAHTLAPSANVGSVLVDITNDGSAGAITTSGFDFVTGDAFTTTDTHVFRCNISIGEGGSLLQVQALQ